MACGFKILLELEYKVPQEKSPGAHGLGSSYNFRMDTIIGKGKYKIQHILCA